MNMGEKLKDIQHTILTSANALRREAKLCDIVLYVQGKRGIMVGYPAHKLVLLNASRYFKGMFERDTLTAQCHFPSLTEEGLFTLLDIIYGRSIPKDNKIEDTLYAAKYLQVEAAVEYLEKKLNDQIHLEKIELNFANTRYEPEMRHKPVKNVRPEGCVAKRVSRDSRKRSKTEPMTSTPCANYSDMLQYTLAESTITGSHLDNDDNQSQGEQPVVVKVEVDEDDPEVFPTEPLPAGFLGEQYTVPQEFPHTQDQYAVTSDGILKPLVDGDLNSDHSQTKKCALCGMECANSSELVQHLNTVHRSLSAGIETSRFQCKICGRQFTQLVNLQTHMRIHTGQKPYMCNICRRPFRHRNSMLRHIGSIHKQNDLAAENDMD